MLRSTINARVAFRGCHPDPLATLFAFGRQPEYTHAPGTMAGRHTVNRIRWIGARGGRDEPPARSQPSSSRLIDRFDSFGSALAFSSLRSATIGFSPVSYTHLTLPT